MTDGPGAARSRPPLGGWPRVYALVIGLALLVLLLLWWVTARFNIPLAKA